MPFCLLFFFCFFLYLWKKSKNLLSWGMKNKFILHFALDLNILKKCDDFKLPFSLCTNCQLSILQQLLFLIYINNLPKGLQCNQKLFAADTFLFSTVQDISTNTVNLNNDLTKILEWALQLKMNFNPDASKLFSRKNKFQAIPITEF